MSDQRMTDQSMGVGKGSSRDLSEEAARTPGTASAAGDRGTAAADLADPEFVAWAAEHKREQRLHEAELAQITTHPDTSAEQDAIGQQQAWARRHAHERHLHDSAIAQIRPS